MVNGRLIVRGRRMLTLNQAQVIEAGRKYGSSIRASLGK